LPSAPRIALTAGAATTSKPAGYDLNGSFEEYWSGRGKNLRQNMRKQRNRLAAEGVTAQMRSLTHPADIAAAIERYGALESAGWKAAQGTAIHPDNAQGSFYRCLLEYRRRDAARPWSIEYLFADRVVASNLCLRRGKTLVVLKTTYDESDPVLTRRPSCSVRTRSNTCTGEIDTAPRVLRSPDGMAYQMD
jgi:hypothetical protein